MEYKITAREVGDRRFNDLVGVCTIGRFACSEFQSRRYPGVPLRSTPGFMLSPRSARLGILITSLSWGSAALHPRLYAIATLRGLS